MRFRSILFFAIGVSIIVSGHGPKIAYAGDPPLLRYGFKPSQPCRYDFEYCAAILGRLETRTGSLHFSVVDAPDDQFSIRRTIAFFHAHRGLNGTVIETYSDMRSPGAGKIVMPRRSGPAVRAAADGQAAAPALGRLPSSPSIFTRSGELIAEDGNDPLPLLLGYQDQLTIEPLPPQPTASWSKKSDVKLLVDESNTTATAKEEVQYAVVATTGKIVHLTKTYSLRTEPNAKGVSLLTMTGCGNLEFDTGAGMFRSGAMTYVLVLSRDAGVTAVPITLSYQLWDAQSIAAQNGTAQQMVDATRKRMEEKREELRRAAEARAEANKPKPLTPELRAAALQDLRSSDENIVKAAAKRLAHASADDRSDEVSLALVQAMARLNEWGKADLLDALAVWGTSNCESALIEASRSTTFFVRNKALEQLGRKFKDEAAIAAIVAQFHADRGIAGTALKKIGPAAEKAVVPLLKESDFWVRCEVIGVLREIGGQRSLRALRREIKVYLPKNNMLEINPFNDAIAAIERRLATEAQSAGPADREPKTRSWADLSGTFEIEATFVGVKDHKVTLKKKDGREITVPLEKLSEDDQEYVNEQLKSQAEAKPVNPFE